MKFIAVIFMFYVAFVTSEINLETFDWSSVRPLYEIEEWRKVHSNVMIPPANAHPVRSPRVIDGNFRDNLIANINYVKINF